MRKRTRTEADESDSFAPKVKTERSQTPLVTERRFVTAGTKRFAPIPNDCLPSCAQYRQNRLKWVDKCAGELEALNLVPERKLVRDDGLIIDWRSHVPVLADTLKPDPLDLAATIVLAHTSNAHWHRSPICKDSHAVSAEEHHAAHPLNIPDTEPPQKKRVPVPPRPLSRRRNNISRQIPANSLSRPSSSSSHPERHSEEGGRDAETHLLARDNISNLADHMPILPDTSARHGQVAVPSGSAITVHDQSIDCSSSADEEEISEMTLNYLRRYVQTYESDRASLASAYARNASFAYRVRQLAQSISGDVLSVGAVSAESHSSGTRRTRLDIMTTLLTLPSLHSDAEDSNTAHVEYDMFYLGTDLGMFVVCRVVLSTKTVVHNFILQRKDVDLEDVATEAVWALTATAHQILVFQT